MGRGDNRKSPKVRQRRAWRKAKSRLAAKIAGGSASIGAGKKSSPSTIVKKKAKAAE